MSKQRTDDLMKHDNLFMSFGRIFIAIICLIFMGILTASSLISTTGMEIIGEGEDIDSAVYRIKEGIESVVYYNDGIIGNLIWLAFCLLLCFLILPLMKKVPLWLECVFVAGWTFALGFIWVNSSKCAPTEDSYWVTEAALQFYRGESYILNEWYFPNYSFQLGYVLFNELLIRLYSVFYGAPENLIFLQVVNAAMLAASYVAIIIMNSLIFKDKRVHHMTALLLLFAAQPVIFCSFLYGIIPGMTFAILALLFMVLYLQRNRLHWGILSAVCIMLAVTLKSNNNIVLVAIMGSSFVALFKRKKYIKDFIVMALTLVLSLSLMPVVKSYVERRADVDLGEPIPYSAWFYMGLNEADNGPGWYNPYYTLMMYGENDHDPAKMNADVMDRMKERVKYFLENPQYRNDFFYKKFVSQWNETSYQSIWNNQVRYNYSPRGKIAEWVCTDGTDSVKSYMDIYTQLIFVAVLCGLIACLKNRNFLSVTMPLVILGGMLYHLLAEAKSQYAIPYFILMIGFAGYGICVLNDRLAKKTADNRAFAFIFRGTADMFAEPPEIPAEIPAEAPENASEESAAEAPANVTDVTAGESAEVEIPAEIPEADETAEEETGESPEHESENNSENESEAESENNPE